MMKKRNLMADLGEKVKLLLVVFGLGLVTCSYPGQAFTATEEGIKYLHGRGIVGSILQAMVVARAEGILAVNRPYMGNGVVDCYGYVRQVWNPILSKGNHHPEDFKTANYTQNVMRDRINQANGLPVADCVSSNWAPIDSIGLDKLIPGDVVGTVQGHAWGFDVHYGLYAGKVGSKHYQYDCGGGGGAYKRSWWSGFKYYYVPTHMLLCAGNNDSSSQGSQSGHWKLF